MSFSLCRLSHLSCVGHWECLAYFRDSANYQFCVYAANSGNPSWVSKMDLSISLSFFLLWWIHKYNINININTIIFVFRFHAGAAVRCGGGRTLQALNFLAIIRLNIRVRRRAIQRQIVFKNNLNTRNGFILLKLLVKCYCVNYSNIHGDIYILIVINSSSSWHKVVRALLLNEEKVQVWILCIWQVFSHLSFLCSICLKGYIIK